MRLAHLQAQMLQEQPLARSRQQVQKRHLPQAWQHRYRLCPHHCLRHHHHCENLSHTSQRL
jgi:hypothetical protein